MRIAESKTRGGAGLTGAGAAYYWSGCLPRKRLQRTITKFRGRKKSSLAANPNPATAAGTLGRRRPGARLTPSPGPTHAIHRRHRRRPAAHARRPLDRAGRGRLSRLGRPHAVRVPGSRAPARRPTLLRAVRPRPRWPLTFGPVLDGPSHYAGLVCNILVRTDATDWRVETISQVNFQVGPGVVTRDHTEHFTHPDGTRLEGYPQIARFGTVELVT